MSKLKFSDPRALPDILSKLEEVIESASRSIKGGDYKGALIHVRASQPICWNLHDRLKSVARDAAKLK